jgi:drug/metabolite transporter (DMT)-like permease
VHRAAATGTALAVLSAGTFGTSGSFATSLLDVGWTPGAAVTARIAVAAAVLTVPAVLQARGRWAALRGSARGVLVYGLFAIVAAQLCFFEAVEHLSVGVALLLEYSGTLLVVAWTWLVHGQRPQWSTVVGGVLALGGLVLVLDLTGAQHVDVVGVLWGLGAATGLAVYFVVSAHAEHDAVPPVVMAWAGMVVAVVALAVASLVHVLPFAATASDVTLAGHRTSWVVPVLGMSLLAAVIAYVAGIGAARRLGARPASFLGLAEVLFAMLFAWVLLGQRPTALQAIGGAIVLAGIALVRADAGAPLVEPPSAEPADSELPTAA